MAAALAGVLAMAVACPAGQWLSAQLPQGRPPFDPVALFWFRVARNPVIYRQVVDVPKLIDRATVAVRSGGYLYICVDGRQAYAWGPDKDTAERPRVTGEPARVHLVDLSEQLTPGRHVLTVSAPAGTSVAGGFVLDGGLYAGGKRAWPLASDESWSATAFRPTEIVEDSPVMRPDYDGQAVPGVCTGSLKVRAVGQAWSAGEDELAGAHFKARLDRVRRDVDDAAWLLGLLADKGIYVVDGSAFGWGGPGRPGIAPLAETARQSLAVAGKLRGRIDGLAQARLDAAAGLAEKSSALANLDAEAASFAAAAKDLCSQARDADAETAARLGALRADLPAAGGWQDADCQVSPLNQSRHDRLGWLPLPELADTDLAGWGVQIKPGDAQEPPAVLATPLSPCVVISPCGGELEIRHAGPAEMLLPGGKWADAYDAEKNGRLKANWVLLWLAPDEPAGTQRPILLVFEKQPAAINAAAGATKLKLGWKSRVIAVRPWLRAVPKKDADAVAKMAAFWSRAALAVPINYLSVTRVLEKARPWQDISIDSIPPGPLIAQRVLYDYLLTKDQWGTEPLMLAPLPALCGLALDCKYPTLELDEPAAVQVVQDGGLAGPYRAVAAARTIGYRYRVEPWPRLVGFTSWMFGQADTGVPGNKREMEIIAAAGANSYRPQHNFSDEPAAGFGPDEKRTRVQVLADCCRDAGATYINNIDQTLGPYQNLIRDDYDKWVRTVLLPHYDKLLGQLAQRPFRQVAYDLINEPADHQAGKYNAAMKLLTSRIRQTDRRHLLYVEPCQSWGAIKQLRLVEPTGDGLTMYSFHDYSFRMKAAGDRWPSAEADISTICRKWWPAFEFAIRHGVGMHCGEFGGFHEPTDDSLCQTTLLNDFFRIFDQFGMHSHYYTGRGIYQRQLDGSLRPGNVVRAYRQYTARKDLNCYYGSRRSPA
jgi:hypothetical protein